MTFAPGILPGVGVGVVVGAVLVGLIMFALPPWDWFDYVLLGYMFVLVVGFGAMVGGLVAAP